MCVDVPNCAAVGSSAKFKNNIKYVSGNGLAKLHDETMRVRLATYKYKSQFGDPEIKHLGFIIQDNPKSVAVDGAHQHADPSAHLSEVAAPRPREGNEIAHL